MSRQKVKFEKKYVSRYTLQKHLKLDTNEFQQLCILTNTLPSRSKPHQRTDNLDTVFYSVASAKEMINSQIFLDLNRIRRLNQKRKKFKNLNRYKNNIKIDYEKLALKKYNKFETAIAAMPFSIKLISLKLRMFEFKNENENLQGLFEIFNVLKTHFKFLVAFLGNNGFYFKVGISKITINFFIPYQLENIHTNIVFETLVPVCNAHLILLSKKIRESFICKKENSIKNGKLKIKSKYKNIYEILAENCFYEVVEFDYQFIVSDENPDEIEINVFYVHPQFLFDSINENCNFKNYLWGCVLPKQRICVFEQNDLKEQRNIKYTQSKNTSFKMEE